MCIYIYIYTYIYIYIHKCICTGMEECEQAVRLANEKLVGLVDAGKEASRAPRSWHASIVTPRAHCTQRVRKYTHVCVMLIWYSSTTLISAVYLPRLDNSCRPIPFHTSDVSSPHVCTKLCSPGLRRHDRAPLRHDAVRRPAETTIEQQASEPNCSIK